MTKEELIKISKGLYRNIESNIHQVVDLYDSQNEIDNFYYGLISRQLMLITDMSCLLSNQYLKNFTGLFILGRSIIDDFMPLHYSITSQSPKDEIVKFNALGHKNVFKKLDELADLNERILDANFPYYPTKETVKNLKDKFSENNSNDKYFTDKSNFKLKNALNKRQLIDTYKGKDSEADLFRAYYRWRQFSDYVHYSKYSYNFIIQNQTILNQYDDIAEIFAYGYYGSKLIMKYFESEYNVEHIKFDRYENVTIQYFSHINK